MLRGFIKTIFLCVLMTQTVDAQDNSQIRWITFEQLDDSLAVNPKSVFLDFYTDWCTYCRKMDKVIFTDEAVSDKVNKDYYAVRFDAETRDSVFFDGAIYLNDEVGKKRKPTHQLAKLLATRNDDFNPPAMVFLSPSFEVTGRYFEYLDRKKMLALLSQHAD